MVVAVHCVGEIGHELIRRKGLAQTCYSCKEPIGSEEDFVSSGSPRRYRHRVCAEEKNLV